MKELNIPIYRAKKIDSEEYVEGYLLEDYGIGFYIQTSKYLEFIISDRGERGIEVDYLIQIDISTLSIHFPDMLDSEGNKIFASLSEDGKGGDIIESDYGDYAKAFTVQLKHNYCIPLNEFKVIGIQIWVGLK